MSHPHHPQPAHTPHPQRASLQLELSILSSSFAVCKIGCDDLARSSAELTESGDKDRGYLARWLISETLAANVSGDFFSITHTKDEVSVVCVESRIPPAFRSLMRTELQYRALKVKGPLDFTMIGILANISHVLSSKGISIFVMSTYDTDYIFVKDDRLTAAILALQSSGHVLRTEPTGVSPHSHTAVTPTSATKAHATAVAINNYQGMTDGAFPDDQTSFSSLVHAAGSNVSSPVGMVYGVGVHAPVTVATAVHRTTSLTSVDISTSNDGHTSRVTRSNSATSMISPVLASRSYSGSIDHIHHGHRSNSGAVAAMAGGLYSAMPSSTMIDNVSTTTWSSPTHHTSTTPSPSHTLSATPPSLRPPAMPSNGSFYTSTIGSDDFVGGGVHTPSHHTNTITGNPSTGTALHRATIPPFSILSPSSITGHVASPPQSLSSRVTPSTAINGGMYSTTIGGSDFADYTGGQQGVAHMRSPSLAAISTSAAPSTLGSPVSLHHSISGGAPLPYLPSTLPASGFGSVRGGGRYHGSLSTNAASPACLTFGATINLAAMKNYGAFGASADWADSTSTSNNCGNDNGQSAVSPPAHLPLTASVCAPYAASVGVGSGNDEKRSAVGPTIPAHTGNIPAANQSPPSTISSTIATNSEYMSGYMNSGDCITSTPTSAGPTSPLSSVASTSLARHPSSDSDNNGALGYTDVTLYDTANTHMNTSASTTAATTPTLIAHTTPAASATKTPLVLVMESLSCFRACDREEAKLLLRDTPAGTYLVRKSSEGYVLSYSVPPKANHVIIYRFPEGLCLRREGTSTMHRSLEALVRSAIGERARPL